MNPGRSVARTGTRSARPLLLALRTSGGGDLGARGQRRPGLERRRGGTAPPSRAAPRCARPGRPGRHALPGTWPSPRPRFPKRIPGARGQNRCGAGLARASGLPKSRAAHPTLPGPAWCPPPRTRAGGAGMGARPRGRAPGLYGALGGTPDRRCADRTEPRGPTPAAAGPRRQRPAAGAPRAAPRPPTGPARPPLTWRRAGARGAAAPRGHALSSRSVSRFPSAAASASARPDLAENKSPAPPAASPPARLPSPASDTASGSASARVTPPRPPRAAPPTRRARQRPAHSRHHPPRAPPRPGPAQRRLRPRSPPACAEPTRTCGAGAAQRAVAAAVPRRREPGAPPVSPRTLPALSSVEGQTPVCSPSVTPRQVPPEPNLKRPHPPGPRIPETHQALREPPDLPRVGRGTPVGESLLGTVWYFHQKRRWVWDTPTSPPWVGACPPPVREEP